MKVKLGNLKYGLLMVGLPFAAWANVEADNVRAELTESVMLEQSTMVGKPGIAPEMLDSAFGIDPALQEALREHLRAWTDKMEAEHRQYLAGDRVRIITLARS